MGVAVALHAQQTNKQLLLRLQSKQSKRICYCLDSQLPPQPKNLISIKVITVNIETRVESIAIIIWTSFRFIKTSNILFAKTLYHTIAKNAIPLYQNCGFVLRSLENRLTNNIKCGKIGIVIRWDIEVEPLPRRRPLADKARHQVWLRSKF